MPVKKDPDGRRSVEVEVEVPGTPEEVWRTIATGPGISSWFVPSQVEEREGGKATSNFGPGMDSAGLIKSWEPPNKFVIETTEGPGPVATEWTVEARSGGMCVVRVVHSWFGSNDDWDAQFEGHTEGWRMFFRILRLYLSHFQGEPSVLVALTGFGPEPKARVWESLMDKLGLKKLGPVAVGQRIETSGDAPRLAGVAERVGEAAFPELLLRLDQPAPGVAHLFAMPLGGQVLLSLRFYLYGPQGPALAGQVESQWQAFLQQNFPMPTQA